MFLNKWLYFAMTQDGKKGELLYTETYKDGELVKRVFIK